MSAAGAILTLILLVVLAAVAWREWSAIVGILHAFHLATRVGSFP